MSAPSSARLVSASTDASLCVRRHAIIDLVGNGGLVQLHSWLERRVQRCAHYMEDAVTRIFTRSLSEAMREHTAAA